MKFQIGEHVILKKGYGGPVKIGMEGVVKRITTDGILGIEWEGIEGLGHNGLFISKTRSGWWVHHEYVESGYTQLENE